MKKKIKKLFISNRGEIAVRIIRACRKLGIKTVIAYSDIDKWSRAVSLADEAYPLHGNMASETYINIDKIIRIVKDSGADGVHPGYGFLAENYDFALRCHKEGIIFVGPRPEVIKGLGDKINARKIAQKAGVSTIPGISGIKDYSKLIKKVTALRFPILIKAVSGGGGKGMRIVRKKEEFKHLLNEAKSEAKSSFRNPDVYVEKYYEESRHIEMQMIGDEHKNVVCLGERECSIQRRQQKLLEEAPAVSISDDIRIKMKEAAIQIFRDVNYTNAGTVEFLLDENDNFYFLEVNTRLQVEHPVTELVTGIDLVVEQIKIAMGKKLSFKQKDIKVNGHSIECRIYAEDPYDDFMPSVGTVRGVEVPSGPFVRVDSALRTGEEITMFYDPLISKLICWGKNRNEAIDNMLCALKEYKITGIHTAIPFFIQLLNDESYRKGDIYTTYIENAFNFSEKINGKEDEAIAIAASLEYIEMKKKSVQISKERTKTSRWNNFSFINNKRF